MALLDNMYNHVPSNETSLDDLKLLQRILRAATIYRNREVDLNGISRPDTRATTDKPPNRGTANRRTSGRKRKWAPTKLQRQEDNGRDNDRDDDGNGDGGGDDDDDEDDDEDVIDVDGEDDYAKDDDDDDDDEDNDFEPAAKKVSKQRPNQKEAHPVQERPHAASEKRYRSTVNRKIQLLHESLPDYSNLNGAGKSGDANKENHKTEREPASKPVILQRAIQYIDQLVSTYQQSEAEKQELRKRLEHMLDVV